MTGLELLNTLRGLTDIELSNELILRDIEHEKEYRLGINGAIIINSNRLTLNTTVKQLKQTKKSKSKIPIKISNKHKYLLIDLITRNMIPINSYKDFISSAIDALEYLKLTPGYDEMFKGIRIQDIDTLELYNVYIGAK